MTKELWQEYYSKDNIDFMGEAYAEFRLLRAEVEAGFSLKVLNLKKGDAVLDLCCGMGDNSIYLANKGLKVVGVDYSKDFLDKAIAKANIAKAKKRKSSVEFFQMDARDLNFKNKFDAAVMLFNSFGYCEKDEDNFKILKSLSDSLKPNGKFLIEFLNRDYAIKISEKGFEKIEVPGGYQELSYRFDLNTQLFFTQRKAFVYNQKKEMNFCQKAYSISFLESMLQKSNLTNFKLFGGYEEKTINAHLANLVISGNKANQPC